MTSSGDGFLNVKMAVFSVVFSVDCRIVCVGGQNEFIEPSGFTGSL